ncbi:MAG: hypothetical protein R2879_15385 [Saprospiraceae bacterium]
MIRLLQTLFFLFVISVLNGQAHYQVWPFGYGNNLDNSFGISFLDFRYGEVNVYPVKGVDKYSLDSAGSAICADDGTPLLIANNCDIRNADFEIILNGDTLNPGPLYESHCVTFGIYPSPQSSIMLPGISDSLFYLVHKNEFVSSFYRAAVSDSIYFSKIKMNHLGEFELLEKKIISEALTNPGRISATKTRNGKGWWINSVKFATNEFLLFRIENNTVIGPISSNIGPALTQEELGIAQVSFSPDGSLIAFGTEEKGIFLFHFENETGNVKSYENFHLPDNKRGVGLNFSPNGRFVYVSTGEDLYQVDLQNDNELVFLAHHYEPGSNGWPVGIGFIYPGPDCRLYIAPESATFYMHVIHSPNEKGLDCDLEIRAIRTPTRISNDIINIPNVNHIQPCDSSIQWNIPSGLKEEKAHMDEILSFPNPFVDGFELTNFPEGMTQVELSIFRSFW